MARAIAMHVAAALLAVLVLLVAAVLWRRKREPFVAVGSPYRVVTSRTLDCGGDDARSIAGAIIPA